MAEQQQKQETKEPKVTFPKKVYHQMWGEREIGGNQEGNKDYVQQMFMREYEEAKRDGWTDDDPRAKDKEKKDAEKK